MTETPVEAPERTHFPPDRPNLLTLTLSDDEEYTLRLRASCWGVTPQEYLRRLLGPVSRVVGHNL